MSHAGERCTKDDFHRERSRFLDAFAGLEEALLAVPDAPQDKRVLEQLKSLRQVRNDLVHSQLRFTQFDGKLHAIVINAQDSAKTAKPCRIVTLDDFKALASEIGHVKRSLG